MKLRVILETSEEGGFTVTVPSLPGCISEGESREEAIRNIREAIELYLEPVEDDQIFSPDVEMMELAV
jgi:predicted RNase H-like HicB family nuclease